MAFFEGHCMNLTPQLAIAKFELWRAEGKHRRTEDLRARLAAGGSIVVIPPVPPHILRQFGTLRDATIVSLDGHHLPHGLAGRRESAAVIGPYAARQVMEAADTIVFDAYFNGAISVRRSLASLLDPRLIKETAELMAHGRPHPDPDDVEIESSMTNRITQI
jgi:hypothetical protein